MLNKLELVGDKNRFEEGLLRMEDKPSIETKKIQRNTCKCAFVVKEDPPLPLNASDIN